MFTGLVEEVGSIRQMYRSGETMKLTITCNHVLEGTQIGDSIAVNGICLTATELGKDYFVADVMPETVRRTHLKKQSPGALVNLERAVAAGQRMGGHFVQGHVDDVGVIQKRHPYENAVLFQIQVAEEWTELMIKKGSIAVNGISLTLVDVGSDFFTVSIIPHTLNQTQLQVARVGDEVNIECDLIGKYLAKWMGKAKVGTGLTLSQLQQNGFA